MLPNVGVHNVRGIAFGDHSIDRSLSTRSTCELQTNSGPQSCLSRRLQVSTRVLPTMWERGAVQEFRRPWLAMAGPLQKFRRPQQYTRRTHISTRRNCARLSVVTRTWPLRHGLSEAAQRETKPRRRWLPRSATSAVRNKATTMAARSCDRLRRVKLRATSHC